MEKLSQTYFIKFIVIFFSLISIGFTDESTNTSFKEWLAVFPVQLDTSYNSVSAAFHPTRDFTNSYNAQDIKAAWAFPCGIKLLYFGSDVKSTFYGRYPSELTTSAKTNFTLDETTVNAGSSFGIADPDVKIGAQKTAHRFLVQIPLSPYISWLGDINFNIITGYSILTTKTEYSLYSVEFFADDASVDTNADGKLDYNEMTLLGRYAATAVVDQIVSDNFGIGLQNNDVKISSAFYGGLSIGGKFNNVELGTSIDENGNIDLAKFALSVGSNKINASVVYQYEAIGLAADQLSGGNLLKLISSNPDVKEVKKYELLYSFLMSRQNLSLYFNAQLSKDVALLTFLPFEITPGIKTIKPRITVQINDSNKSYYVIGGLNIIGDYNFSTNRYLDDDTILFIPKKGTSDISFATQYVFGLGITSEYRNVLFGLQGSTFLTTRSRELNHTFIGSLGGGEVSFFVKRQPNNSTINISKLEGYVKLENYHTPDSNDFYHTYGGRAIIDFNWDKPIERLFELLRK